MKMYCIYTQTMIQLQLLLLQKMCKFVVHHARTAPIVTKCPTDPIGLWTVKVQNKRKTKENIS